MCGEVKKLDCLYEWEIHTSTKKSDKQSRCTWDCCRWVTAEIRKSTNRCILVQDVFLQHVRFGCELPLRWTWRAGWKSIQKSDPIFSTHLAKANLIADIPQRTEIFRKPKKKKQQPPRCTGVKLEISSLKNSWWFGYSRTAKQLQPLEALIQSRENGNLCLSKVWLICGEKRWNNEVMNKKISSNEQSHLEWQKLVLQVQSGMGKIESRSPVRSKICWPLESFTGIKGFLGKGSSLRLSKVKNLCSCVCLDFLWTIQATCKFASDTADVWLFGCYARVATNCTNWNICSQEFHPVVCGLLDDVPFAVDISPNQHGNPQVVALKGL